ncbi:MAG: hypothetical protein KDD58_04875 [Bdellovibrionales bacterium]|nr:hypothetical protein [Bdellovibrionales bacterium]
MKHIQLLLFTIVLWSLPATAVIDNCKKESATTQGKDEGFPWPWSYQCEFNWQDIVGEWQLNDNQLFSGKYTMEVYKMNPSNESFLLVVQYDEEGRVVSRGLGLPSNHQRGLMVPMQWVKESEGINGYWLHLSYIVEGESDVKLAENLCVTGKGTKLAVKMTSFGKNQDERPPKYLEKIPNIKP